MSAISRLRSAGSLPTAVGALVAGVGSALTWVTVGLALDRRGVLDQDFRGLDLYEGVLVLVLSLATLALVATLRFLRANGKMLAAVSLVLVGVALVAMPISIALRAEDRAVDEMARIAADTGGLTREEAIELIRDDPDLAVRSELGPGLWLSIGGGMVVVLGASAALGSARGSDRAPDG